MVGAYLRVSLLILAILLLSSITFAQSSAPTRVNVIPSPSSLIFFRDETSKDVIYTLSLTGPFGVRINQETVAYKQDGRIIRRETSIISKRIPAGGKIDLSRNITINDTLRSLILGGRPSASFTLRREFSGFDDRANSISAEAIINVEVRTALSETFEVTSIEVILPDGPLKQGEGVRATIRFSTSGPPGYVAGNLYIDDIGWHGFSVDGITNGDEIETPPLPTSSLDVHTLSLLLSMPNRVEAAATYEVVEVREFKD